MLHTGTTMPSQGPLLAPYAPSSARLHANFTATPPAPPPFVMEETKMQSGVRFVRPSTGLEH